MVTSHLGFYRVSGEQSYHAIKPTAWFLAFVAFVLLTSLALFRALNNDMNSSPNIHEDSGINELSQAIR